jgi:hypothetical protein
MGWPYQYPIIYTLHNVIDSILSISKHQMKQQGKYVSEHISSKKQVQLVHLNQNMTICS